MPLPRSFVPWGTLVQYYVFANKFTYLKMYRENVLPAIKERWKGELL